MQRIGMNGILALLTLIVLALVFLGKSGLGSLIILGEISVSDTIKKGDELVKTSKSALTAAQSVCFCLSHRLSILQQPRLN